MRNVLDLRLLLIITLLTLTSCAFSEHLRNQMTIPPHSERIEPVDPTDALTEIERCEQNAKWLDGSNACDLVVYNIQKEYPQLAEYCKTEKLSDLACGTKIMNVMFARFSLKYPSADYKRVDLWCQSEPIVCSSKTLEGRAKFEVKLKESHEEEVRKVRNAKRAEEAKDQRERTAAALMYFGNAVKSNPMPTPYMMPTQRHVPNNSLNCTSQKIGTMVHTNCN